MQRPEFVEFSLDFFEKRVEHYRNKAFQEHHRASADEFALAHDRRLFPKKSTNCLGEPRWDGSLAEASLKKDIDNEKHNVLKPEALHRSRKECQVFALEVFRKHIHQEVKKRKYIAWCKNRAEQKEKGKN